MRVSDATVEAWGMIIISVLTIILMISVYFMIDERCTTQPQDVKPDTVYVKVVHVPTPEEDYAERYNVPVNLASKIRFYAERHGIDTDLAHGLVAVESRFDPYAVSHVGAMGLTQLMGPTARAYLGDVPDSVLFDVDTNLDTGFQYLAHLLDRFDGDVYNALAAYNAGPTRVAYLIRTGTGPRRTYANKVLREAGK